MKWQSTLWVILPLWLATVCSLHADIAIYLSNDAAGLHYCMNDRSMSEQKLTNVLSRLGNMDTNQTVFLLCSTNVLAPQVAEAIGHIQQAGFSHVIFMASAIQGGTNGIFQVTLDCTKYEFGEWCGTGGQHWTSGFRAASEDNHTWARYLIEKSNQVTNISQAAGPRDGGPAAHDP